MRKNLAIIITFFTVFIFASGAVSAQITIKLPNINVQKPVKDQTKINDTNTTGKIDPKTSNSELIYKPQRPTATPVLLKNSIYIQAKTHNQYWKMPNQRNHSSWVPVIKFSNFYNNDKKLNYTVEYYNPDNSLWYSENLEQGFFAADRTVAYSSPSPYGSGVLDSKSTDKTGVFSFKITDQDAKEVVFQGKFKVGKFSTSYNAQEKNKNDFYVEHDWLLPFAVIGFHHSLDEVGGMMPEVGVWLKGAVSAGDLEGRIFYKGQQIASTKDGASGSGVSDYDERTSEFAPSHAPQNIWKRWQFQWGNFRFDNNGTFNRDNYPNAFYADKNPGDYTVKILRGGTEIRELKFSVGADGRFVVPAYTNQIPLPYHRIILPVKITGTTEKWDSAAWKTDAFYGNPISGFAMQ